MKILILLLSSVAAFAQSYPSSIHTALVAKDNISTTLISAMQVSDTVAVVASSTGWLPQMVAYICDGSTTGQLKCTGTFEVMLVTAVAGNVITVTRGYGGTTAVAHATGRAFLNAPAAVYTTTSQQEIEAIETALGTNLSNVTSPVIKASTYNFTPQAPGGSIFVGSNSITLTPCPLGVSGANALYSVYLSGGTGLAEVVSVTGGTCTSGATTGTLIVTAAHTHTGAWTLGPATGGIQEAVCSLPTTGGQVLANADVTLLTNVTKCGKTQPSVNKLAGVSITGSFAVLEQVADPNLTEYMTGPLNISAKLGTFNNKVTGFAVVPEMHDPFPASYGAGIAVGQPDQTKLDANQFLHGIAVDMRTNNIGPTNQNAAVLGFMQSYGGADPFGGDFHGVLPSTATAAPNYVIGVQGTAQLDSNTYVPTTAAYPVLANCASNAIPKKPCNAAIVVLGDPSNLILANDSTSMGGEGVVLQPADDLNAGYRAFGIVNHAGTQNNWYADKAGDTFTRGYDTFVVGANVASANTITPTGTIFHVTGTAAIATINFPSSMVSAGGCLHLIPDAAFTTVTGSNIALASTAVVNKMLTMCLDPGTGKAYPSY